MYYIIMYNINLKATAAESHVKNPARVTCQNREKMTERSEIPARQRRDVTTRADRAEQ